MAERRTPSADAEGVDLACFELAGRQYAVPIGRVREILATPAVTPLPDAPALIEGVIDLRGHLVPVLDLASVLARPDDRAAEERGMDVGPADHGARVGSARGEGLRMVVVETSGFVVGFRVDRATRVVSAAREALEPLPALTQEAGCRVVGAVVRQGDRPPILVLELDTLIDRVRGPARTAAVGDGVAA